MPTVRILIRSVALAVAILPAALPAHAAKVIFSTLTGEPITLAKLVEDVSNARVILFGEIHDNPGDHTAQRTLLQALDEAGVNIALGMEMFRADAQPALDSWIAGTLNAGDFANAFAANWEADLYPLYRDMLYYARQEGIPLVGLNIDRGLTAKVYRSGFDSLRPEERNRLGNVTCDIDEKYKALLSRALGGKKGPPEQFIRFCEAQVLWDVSMAANALSYLRANPDRKLMIICGTYHAWKHGIPKQISRLSEMPVKVILPSRDPTFENYRLIADEADFAWRQE